ncbi:uncharacterized protein LOC6534870 [Drosophila yakuba]|uniref:Uncharacterized protein, isoform A n=1 Tax=Drosophila yakuba TaxID=7245 RepID=B4IUD8_DROYA|nr:uncharacterized protein LOC6534870 [Drosophila yakuba]XP_015050890.2 uncharacterized protein LOC6534870 [Drosophila yakuba]EDX00002.1 uncharacterized protein Dyak_GE22761, isoform A [Drosophila yakuba]KRK05331.1 uncharacterized protein Dyak_GE22761, isoform B [Drosophila yakuba]
MLIKLLVLFLLYRKTLGLNCYHNHSADHDHYDCGCCAGISNNNGKVIGYHCHSDDQESILRYTFEKESAFTACVPNGFEIKYPILEYCCFWSPNLGCTILVNEKYINDKVVCNHCKHFCQRTTGSKGSSKYVHKLVMELSLLMIGCTYF